MRIFFALLALSICPAAFSQPSSGVPTPLPDLIPAPVSETINSGHFILPHMVLIEAGDQQALARILEDLRMHLSVPTGYNVTVTRQSSRNATIRLILNTKPEASLGSEGYTLNITSKSILIRANQPAGLFYGVQTLFQLFPPAIESRLQVHRDSWEAPCVTITDYPRFGWRGLMLDVSRHFFSKQEVKDFIDEMVKYKFNLLHMHLTDDEGWRVEIKGLPRLTQVGAWSAKRVGTFGTFPDPAPDEPRDYGGFYTADDIKELVKYAKDRFVNILPEVDIPGHSLAAIVSYPELSCTPGADKYHVRSGEKIMNWYKGGFSAIYDNTLCPANEKVYPFLDTVFTTIAKLFPFPYIHVGGDECAKNFWEQSDAVKQLMQRENLKNMEEVQSYFEKRVEKIVESKGKKVIGWDEILEGGLAPNAAVMSWRGVKGGIAAAKMGHSVVMSPTTYFYLDYMQGDASIEPPVYATLRLKTTYSYEPVPDSVDPKYILGGQANMWNEQVYNTRHLQYMIWPRGMAVAEDLWSPKEKKNWDNFAARVEEGFRRLDVEQVKYSTSMFDAIITPKKDLTAFDSITVDLATEVNGLDIYYSFDNSNPDNFYPKYTGTLTIPKDASWLKVVTYRNGKQIGRQLNLTIGELQRRAGVAMPKPTPVAD
ncbi:MAG TPA: family 20 glycosylhydrolase [Puia sp.]|jgi:hexosaminidase|nr:family 20 glycosylhydrolase [Puia sp.]